MGQPSATDIVNNIFSVTPTYFESLALNVFQYQYAHNPIYRQWTNALGVKAGTVTSLNAIPFMPVSFFKNNTIQTGKFDAEYIFESSGTTGMVNSRHHVKDLDVYIQSFTKGFEHFYGNPADWCIIGLLPAYLERSGSSLVMMVDKLIQLSGHRHSGFYLYDFEKLSAVLQQLEQAGQQTLLIGVTFALLDFAEQFSMPLQHTIIMETGGMKGRRQEMIRQEVHAVLQQQFQLNAIHSEYGMTELLSQGYSSGNGIFAPSPWMKILVREEDDPLCVRTAGRGLINVIDLANIHSCSFIATDDMGICYDNNTFEVLGRSDNSDLRGCSMLYL